MAKKMKMLADVIAKLIKRKAHSWADFCNHLVMVYLAVNILIPALDLGMSVRFSWLQCFAAGALIHIGYELHKPLRSQECLVCSIKKVKETL